MKDFVDQHYTFDDEKPVGSVNSCDLSFFDARDGTLGLDEFQKAPALEK